LSWRGKGGGKKEGAVLVYQEIVSLARSTKEKAGSEVL